MTRMAMVSPGAIRGMIAVGIGDVAVRGFGGAGSTQVRACRRFGFGLERGEGAVVEKMPWCARSPAGWMVNYWIAVFRPPPPGQVVNP